MGLAWIEYARERRGRLSWPLVATIAAAIGLAFVGKICWERFAEPIRQRVALNNHLNSSAEASWEGISFPTTQPLTLGGKTLQDCAGELLLSLLATGAPQGSTLYFGRSANHQRYLFVSLLRTDTTPVRSLTLVVHVFDAGTMFRSPRQIGDAQILPLITFRNAFAVDRLVPSGEGRDLFVLRGTSDDAPFRFELSIDRESRAHLIDASDAGGTVADVSRVAPARR